MLDESPGILKPAKLPNCDEPPWKLNNFRPWRKALDHILTWAGGWHVLTFTQAPIFPIVRPWASGSGARRAPSMRGLKRFQLLVFLAFFWRCGGPRRLVFFFQKLCWHPRIWGSIILWSV